MRLSQRLALAALMSIAPLAGTQAAGGMGLPVVSSPVEVPVADGSGFDWGGFYAGVYGVGVLDSAGNAGYGPGLNVGVNAQLEFLLVGGEVALHALTGDAIDTAYGQVLGKAGLAITEDVLLYAAAGYGISLGAAADDGDILLGAGVEFAVSDDLTVRAQYLHGLEVTSGDPTEQVTIGANFHF